MNSGIIITLIICGTLIVVSIIGKIPTKKATSYFYKDGEIMGVRDEYK